MLRRRGRPFLVADLAVLVAVAVATVLLVRIDTGSGPAVGDSLHPATVLTVEPSAAGRTIPAGFLGLSLEYNAIERYAGDDPAALDPVFVQLIRNLTPGQRPVLRIGGDTTDWTWWPTPGLSRPPGVTFSLSKHWLQVTHALAAALQARLILGINLEADSQALASSEARALIGGLGRSYIDALELGNEPALYALFAWYRDAAGHRVSGRGPAYHYQAFAGDFAQIAGALPSLPLAGPALDVSGWIRHLGQFLAAEPRVAIVTVHRYPLQLCFIPRRSPRYPTVTHLLSRGASAGLASRLAPYAAIAHARGLPLRVDEINTVACGADPAVSKTYAAALWSLDALFGLARAGVDGVNIHTFPSAGYNLFEFARAGSRWRASVAPEYYGLLAFARAAPAGARLLRVAGRSPSWLRAWATRSPAGTIRVVLINPGGTGHAVAVALRGAHTTATLERMRGPRLGAAGAVTIGGQSFGAATDSGTLSGRSKQFRVAPVGGRYVFAIPPYSAALLTVR